MHWLVRESRFALRALGRDPGFTAVSVATLALGIALTTTMFSVVYGVLLERLPYRDADRLMAISATFDDVPVEFSVAEFLDLRRRTRSFSAVAATRLVSGNLTGGDRPERLDAQAVTGEFFPMLGVRPALGRMFTPDDELPGVTPLGVVSHGLWLRRFGGDPQVIGRTVQLDEDAYSIVGVAPPGFEHPGASRANPVDFWLPSGFQAAPFPPPRHDLRLVTLYGRLAPGASVAQAGDELRRLLDELREEYPNDYAAHRGLAFRVEPLHQSLLGTVRRPLLLLLVATGLVLLISCVNVAGLRLARQASRAPELAVRRAIGAAGHRIAGPLVIEGFLLSIAGGALGVALAYGGTAIARWLAPATMQRTAHIEVNPAVLAFAAIAVLAAALAGSIAPALAMSRLDPASALRAGGRGLTLGRWGSRARSALVVAEISLSLLLLACAGVLVRSLWRLQQVEPGFATRDLLTMQLEISYPNDPSRGKYLPQAPRGAYFTEILRRVREVPGVTDVALASWLPLEGEVTESSYTAEGADARTEADAKRVQVIVVSGGYFRVMGIPLRRGRDLTPQDDAEAPPVAVVSETFARQAWPGRDALGKRFKPGPSDSPSPWRTVVGIVPDVRAHRLEDDPVAQVYWSYLADTPTAIRLATRTRSDPAVLAEAIRAAVQTIDRDQPVFAVRTMEQIIGAQLAPRRLATLSLGVFAALAAALAAIGLYGLLSYTVTQRRREIAVRMALGASPGRIVASVCGDGLRLAVAGTAIGLIAAVSLGRVVASLVFGIRPGDLATLLAATCAMLMIALTACLVPARRAAAVDPYAALN